VERGMDNFFCGFSILGDNAIVFPSFAFARSSLFINGEVFVHCSFEDLIGLADSDDRPEFSILSLL